MNERRSLQLLAEKYEQVLLNEDGYEEAWEMFHLKGSDVQKMNRELFGFNYETPEAMNKDPKVDMIAKSLGTFIDKLKIQKLPWNKIPGLKTMVPKWLKAFQSIQDSPNVEQECVKLMLQRDAEGGPRPGGKKPNEKIIKDIKEGLGDPVVLLKMPSAFYAVGGRTRMYAALATKTDVRAIILTPEILQQWKHQPQT